MRFGWSDHDLHAYHAGMGHVFEPAAGKVRGNIGGIASALMDYKGGTIAHRALWRLQRDPDLDHPAASDTCSYQHGAFRAQFHYGERRYTKD